jgi:hypothetical protein
MEELELDTLSCGRVMAQTLAVLHWKAGVGGNDVEFVPSGSLAGRFHIDFNHRSISMWLMDFNQCVKYCSSTDCFNTC